MGIYSDLIRKKEENNKLMEQYADEALFHDQHIRRMESDIDDMQSALIFILDKFHIPAVRRYGYHSVDAVMESMLDPHGIMYRYAESVADEAKERTEYILAYREDGKVVALTPTLLGYQWYCPHDSSRGQATRKYCRSLKPGCYVINQPMQVSKSIVWTFIRNTLKYMTIYDAAYLVISTALVSGLGLLLPRISNWVYNTFLTDPNADTAMLKTVFAMFMTLNIVRGLITLLKQRVLNMLKNRVSIRIQADVMARILHLPRSFFSENSSGKLSKRISNCTNLSAMIINIFLDILLNFSFSGVYLAQMKRLAPELFLPAVIFILLKIIAAILAAIGNAVIDRKSMEVEMESSSFFYSVVRGIQKIKGMGAEKADYAKWAENYRNILHYQYNQPFFLRHQGAIITMLTSAATVTLMGLTAVNGLTRESYMVFTTSYSMVISVASTVTGVMSNLFRMKNLADNVRPIFASKSDTKPNLEYVRHLNGRIRAENIHFSYEDESRGCLRGVSLNVRAGEKIAIVGESGCGKSTLLKILMGMETPDSGAVYFDDKDITLLNQKSLRQRIGSVFQFSKLFPGTIFSNVTFGATEEVSEEEVWNALDKACIGDYIRTLPLGINTEISESNSCGFSGGQRQRILIARALIGKPGVLILDEATSALDNMTQKKVLEAVNELSCTVIMVAHRLSTVENCDKIIMLENGVIAEEGTYGELMERGGKFAKLVEKQLIKEEEEKQKKARPEPVLIA